MVDLDDRRGVLDLSKVDLASRFNKLPFAFDHGLADHPLFETSRLVKLAKSLPSQDIYFCTGDIEASEKWRNLGPPSSTVEEAIEGIERSGSWVILKRVGQDPEFAELHGQCMTALEEELGRPIREAGAREVEGFIFLASPDAVTPFHIDAECSLLYQIRGSKTIHVFDPLDRSVLPSEEIEQFYSGDLQAANYKPEYQDRSHEVRLEPGTGVHLPVIAGHWVKNDSNVSVSFTTSFINPSDRSRRRIYRTNHLLRRIARMDPSDPGKNAAWDWLRNQSGRAIGVAGQIRARLRAKPRS